MAGNDPQFTLQPGEIAYITTGAKLPAGADAVVGVENTEVLSRGANGEEKQVSASCQGAAVHGRTVALSA